MTWCSLRPTLQKKPMFLWVGCPLNHRAWNGGGALSLPWSLGAARTLPVPHSKAGIPHCQGRAARPQTGPAHSPPSDGSGAQQ